MEHSDPQNQLHGHGVHVCFGVGILTVLATGELLGTSNPRKEATRTSPHRWQSGGKDRVLFAKMIQNSASQPGPPTKCCAPLVDAQPHSPRSAALKTDGCSSNLFKSTCLNHLLHARMVRIERDLSKSSQTDWSSFREIQCMIRRGGTLNSFCNIWDGYKRVRNLHGRRTTRRTD